MNITLSKSAIYFKQICKIVLAVIMPIALIISIYAIKANNLQIGPTTPITQSTPTFPDLSPLPRSICLTSELPRIVRPHDDDLSPRQREINVISD